MLTFLRKTRRSIIGTGSTSRYLSYAIGEIALVVIGILIALQINNWNEHKKMVENERDLIRILSNEFLAAHDYLNDRIETIEKGLDSAGNKMLSMTRASDSHVRISEFSSTLVDIFFMGGFSPPSAKFDQVIAGEDMNLIRHDSLQSLLIQYQNQLKLAYNHDSQMEGNYELTSFWNKNMVVHTVVKNGEHGWYDLFDDDDDSAFPMDVSKILSNPEFENIIANRLMLLNSAKKRILRVQRHIRRILDFIHRNYSLENENVRVPS